MKQQHIARVGLALALAGGGCTAESVVPYAPKPDEPRTVALEVTGCSVPVPPIVDWKNWDGRAVFAAADPVVMCKALQMLRDRMAAQPIHFDLTEQIPDNSPVPWSRIEYIFAELLPRHPRAGTEASSSLRPILQLCAEVVGRSHRFCMLIKDHGSDPYFLPGHRS